MCIGMYSARWDKTEHWQLCTFRVLFRSNDWNIHDLSSRHLQITLEVPHSPPTFSHQSITVHIQCYDTEWF